jgi:hypothetical protein
MRRGSSEGICPYKLKKNLKNNNLLISRTDKPERLKLE